MCKSEIFAKIINIVSKETEVSVDQILSSDKKMETVDARYLLVSLRIYFIRMLTRLSNTVRWSAFPLPSRNILWHPLWDSCPKWKWLWMLLSASTGRTRHSKIFLPAWMNADTPDTFLNIRVWMTWANADADAPTVSFINGGGVECPSF